MTREDPGVEAAALALFDARSECRPIDRVSETFGITDPERAYAVQERNTARWLEAGRPLAGRKIGLTSQAVQQQLGVGEPDYGMIWGDLGFEDGAVLPIERFTQPRAEAEIAFVMRGGLDSVEVELPDVVAAIDAATPAVEVVDSAIADWKITLADTIADNASGGGYVLGRDRLPLGALDLEGCRMTLALNGEVTMTLYRNSEPLSLKVVFYQRR